MRPLSPAAAFCNVPTCLQQQIDWIRDAIGFVRGRQARTIEPTVEAETDGLAHHQEVSERMLAFKEEIWYAGANIEGKKRSLIAYAGRHHTYRRPCNQVKDDGYKEFAVACSPDIEELERRRMQLIDNAALNWIRLTGDETFDYPIDYWSAVLSARPDGHVDMLFRWEPNSYCHFHRHLVATTTTVLQGEHHLVDIEKGVELEHRVRTVGDYSHREPDEVHMEYAGPEGSLLLFNMHAPDGRLFDVLSKDETILMTVTIDDFASGCLGAA